MGQAAALRGGGAGGLGRSLGKRRPIGPPRQQPLNCKGASRLGRRIRRMVVAQTRSVRRMGFELFGVMSKIFCAFTMI